MRRVIIFFVLLLITVSSGSGRADSQSENRDLKKKHFYSWTDDKGGMHIADSLEKVPERYRSKANKVESGKSSDIDAVEQRRGINEQYPYSGVDSAEAGSQWRQRIRDWKNRLIHAEKRYEELERERNELFRAWGAAALAPIENKQKAEQIEQQMKEVQQEIQDARNMTENIIPEEARKAGVPPGWLRE